MARSKCHLGMRCISWAVNLVMCCHFFFQVFNNFPSCSVDSLNNITSERIRKIISPVFHSFCLSARSSILLLPPCPRPPSFSKACTFLCKNTQGKARLITSSFPVLLILQYAEYSAFFISLFVMTELLTWAARGKKLLQLMTSKASLAKQSSPNHLLIPVPRRHKVCDTLQIE